MVKLINERYDSGWLIRKFKTPDGVIFCSRTKCEEEIERDKPSRESIEQLRYIKRVRKKQSIEKLVRPNHPLEKELKSIIGKRKENRKKLIKRLANDLIMLYKERGISRITLGDINDLVNVIQNKNTRSSIRRLLINFLIQNKRLKKEFYQKTYYTFEVEPLVTYDKDSWQLIKNKKFVGCGNNISIAREPHKRKVIIFSIL